MNCMTARTENNMPDEPLVGRNVYPSSAMMVTKSNLTLVGQVKVIKAITEVVAQRNIDVPFKIVFEDGTEHSLSSS